LTLRIFFTVVLASPVKQVATVVAAIARIGDAAQIIPSYSPAGVNSLTLKRQRGISVGSSVCARLISVPNRHKPRYVTTSVAPARPTESRGPTHISRCACDADANYNVIILELTRGR